LLAFRAAFTRVEGAGALTVYGLYEVARGLVGADAAEADGHGAAEGFPFVRTTLSLASGLALVGLVVYPTAPPWLAGFGIVDTVSGGHVDLNRGLVAGLAAALAVRASGDPRRLADERPPSIFAPPDPRARSRDPRPAGIRQELHPLVRRPAPH